MNQKPIEIMIADARGFLLTAVNTVRTEMGVPNAFVDLILCSILSDLRNQQNLELINYINTKEKEEKDEQKGEEE
jgi:hypothetical protein